MVLANILFCGLWVEATYYMVTAFKGSRYTLKLRKMVVITDRDRIRRTLLSIAMMWLVALYSIKYWQAIPAYQLLHYVQLATLLVGIMFALGYRHRPN